MMYTYGVDYYVGDVDVVINNFEYGYVSTDVSMDVDMDVDVGICGNGYNGVEVINAIYVPTNN